MFSISRLCAVAAAATLIMFVNHAQAQEDEDEAFLSGGAGASEEEGPTADDATPEDAAATEEEGPAPDEQGAEEATERKRDHRFQGFVNVLFGLGWRMVFPYDKDDPDKACSEVTSPEPGDPPEGDPMCAGRSPMHLDFLGGFGITDGLEVFAMFRLGLDQPDEYQPDQLRMIGAGIKTYSPSDGLFKISFGVAPLFDFSSRTSDAKDFVIHVPIAAHFDFIPWLGSYIQVAPNISFISEFEFDITAGIGVQGRFP